MHTPKLQERAIEVAALINAVMPSKIELADRLHDVTGHGDPHSALEERRALTSAAARLQASSIALLGFLGENDLALADRDDLAAGLADRGLLLPRKSGFLRRGRR